MSDYEKVNTMIMVICGEYPAILAKTGVSEKYFMALVLLRRGAQMETVDLDYLIERSEFRSRAGKKKSCPLHPSFVIRHS